MADRVLKDLLQHVRRLGPSRPGDGTDGQLVERFVRQRDEAAFAALVHRHGPLVLGVGRRILRHHQDAEDVFQATFLLLARHAASRRWQTSIAGWLHTVAYRLAIRAGSQSVRRRQVERAAGRLPATRTEDRPDLYTALDEELGRLADQFREPLVLCYLEGKTRDQAARQLGWSLRTLERRLNQSLKLLRARLGKRGVELPMALLVAGLSHQATSAATLATLTATTLEAVSAGSAVSPRVVELVEQGTKSMTMTTRTKTLLAVVVLLAASTVGAVVGGGGETGDRHGVLPSQSPVSPPSVVEESQSDQPAEATWPEGVPVKGRVVDHRGAAVADAEVLLLGEERVIVEANRTWFVLRGDKERPRPPSVRTDARGEFSLTRQKGTADRLVVIAAAPLFWSVPRKSLSPHGAVEVKLPAPGSLAVRCELPGKAAKQPVMIESQGAALESDFLRFHCSDHSAPNPGEKVFEHLPPGEYTVQRALETPIGKRATLQTMADRQLVKVEADKRATVQFDRRVGRSLTGRVRGLENVELRYAHVTINGLGPEDRGPGGRNVRSHTAFDVLPIKSDGLFTTDPMPPGKYWLDIFVVSALNPEQSNQRSDFNGRVEITVPERGEMPQVEIIAQPNTRPRPPNRDPRVRVVDDAGKPLKAFQAMIHTANEGYTLWEDGRDGQAGFGGFLSRDSVDALDVLVRADGFAPGVARFEGKDREKLRQGEATITMQRGQAVELRFRLPEGLTWPRGTLPEAYFGDYEERVRTMRQPVNRKRGASDFNMLNLREVGAGRFECRLAKDTPPFHVAIHAPGFLQCFECGPFTLADVRQGGLEIAVPRPASLDVRFDPAVPPNALPFQGVSLDVMRQLHGNTYLEVATDMVAGSRHAMKLTDLAPGSYLVTVRTLPGPDAKQMPGTEINPGAYFDRKKLVAREGASESVHFGYTPFDPKVVHGGRTAVVRVRMADGGPARGRQFSVSYFDGHYGSLPVLSGRLPDSGELRLEGLTDRLPSTQPERPYTVSVDDKRVGQFGFTGDQTVQEFEFRLAPRAGDMAPDVELMRLATGKPVRLSSLRGKVVCLEFWATWCGPCQPSMAKLNGLAAEQGASWKDRVVLVPVSIDAERDRVQPHVLRRGWTSLDQHWTGEKADVEFESPAARAFVVNGVPEAVLIGPDGRILWRGHPGDKSQGLESRIHDALKR